MSRAYDAKQAALAAYPDDREKGVDLFLNYINISESDFLYEESYVNTVEEYIYGNEKAPQED